MFANWARVNFVVVYVSEYCFIKFVVECDWNNKISQNVQNLRFFFEKVDGFSEKQFWIFLKNRQKVAILL